MPNWGVSLMPFRPALQPRSFPMSLFGAKTLRVRVYGDPVLRQVAEPVDPTDKKLVALSDAMVASMRASDGVGLAAPQIGESLRLIVLEVPMPKDISTRALSPGEALLLPTMPLTLLNPKVTPVSGGTATAEEGCLSVPKIYAKVTRPEKVFLSAVTLDGERFEIECGGFLARALQHEVDHLDGVLFPDRLDKTELRKIQDRLDSLEKRR